MAGAPSLVSLLLLTPFNPLSLSHPGDHLRLKTQPGPFLTCSDLPRTSHCTHSIHSPSRAHDALRDLVPASCHHATPSCSHHGSLCSSSRASFLSCLCSRLRTFAHTGPPPRMLVRQTLAWLPPHHLRLRVLSSRRPYLTTQSNVPSPSHFTPPSKYHHSIRCHLFALF